MHTYIHFNSLSQHRLLRLAVGNPNKNLKLMILVELGSMAIKSGQCRLCNMFTHDLPKHLILQCKKLLHIRNSLFYIIVDILSVEKSVEFFDQNDDDILESLLGGIHNTTMRSMESDVWESLMCHISDCMYTLYSNFKYVLQFHTFNFGH